MVIEESFWQSAPALTVVAALVRVLSERVAKNRRAPVIATTLIERDFTGAPITKWGYIMRLLLCVTLWANWLYTSYLSGDLALNTGDRCLRNDRCWSSCEVDLEEVGDICCAINLWIDL